MEQIWINGNTPSHHQSDITMSFEEFVHASIISPQDTTEVEAILYSLNSNINNK